MVKDVRAGNQLNSDGFLSGTSILLPVTPLIFFLHFIAVRLIIILPIDSSSEGLFSLPRR